MRSRIAFDSLSSQSEDIEQSSSAVQKLFESPVRLQYTFLVGEIFFTLGVVVAWIMVLESAFTFHSWLTELCIATLSVVVLKLICSWGAYSSVSGLHTAEKHCFKVQLASWFFAPLTLPLVALDGRLKRLQTGPLSGQNVSLEELEDAIEIAGGSESSEDKSILRGIVRFVDTEVDQIMKPRIDVLALEYDTPYELVKKSIMESGYSRIPVYKKGLDNIVGLLYIKDLLPYIDRGNDFVWQGTLREPYFIPEHKKLDDLLEDFQTKKIHMAVVVDEYGGTLGIVTLEDILEEIMGEIADESDKNEDFYKQLDRDTYLFDGRTHIGDFLRVLGLPVSYVDRVRGEADTIAGLMLEINCDFLESGQSVEFESLHLTAQGIQGRRITKVLVKIQSDNVVVNG
ncbi:MAG: CBS domain-containing protein [Mucinivorans sp.]